MTTGIAMILLVLMSPTLLLTYLTQGSTGVEEFLTELYESNIISNVLEFIFG